MSNLPGAVLNTRGDGYRSVAIYIYENVAIDSANPDTPVNWRTVGASDPAFSSAPTPSGTYIDYWIGAVIEVYD